MDRDVYTVDAPTPISRPLLHCPTCGSLQLAPVVESLVEEVHFLCHECARCWTVALGAVQRVAPPSCLGCPERGRCEQVFAADHPRADQSSRDPSGALVSSGARPRPANHL